MARTFRSLGESIHLLDCPNEGLQFEATRLHWERNELHGLLTVRSEIAGSSTIDGVLSVGSFNYSSVSSRSSRAKDLAIRANAPELSFNTLLEELCQKVLRKEGEGKQILLLRNINPGSDEVTISVNGFPVLINHPSIIFGDGGTGKSTLGLYLAGMLEELGYSVLFLDWELDGRDHRRQLERLFGAEMPDVKYCRCERPLIIEAEGLLRQIREGGIDYVVCDSIAFACDGPPEQADVAQRYLRALRQLGIGSLNFAHTTKGENADKRPFGSTFWYNGARQVWFAKRADDALLDGSVQIALYDRKFNLGPRRGDIGFEILYGQERITVKNCEIASNDQLAQGLPLPHRIRQALLTGKLTLQELVDRTGATKAHIERTVNRNGDMERVKNDDGTVLIGLVERKIR